MKKSSKLLIVLSLVSLLCYSQDKKNPNTFTLKANIEALKSNYLVYFEPDEKIAGGMKKDTIWVKDGKFTFTDTVNTYKIYFIDVPESIRSYKQKFGDKVYTITTKAHVSRLWFIGYPGADIHYSGKINGFVDAYPHDKINDDLALINSQIFPLINQTNIISVDMATKDYDDQTKKTMYEKSVKIYEKVNELKLNFIKANPSSIAASYIFSDSYYRKEYTHEQAKEIFANMDAKKLNGTPFYEEVKNRLEAVEKTGIGMAAPEIKTNYTLNGSEFKLSSLKGKYVLLDYWGTWCGPCMADMPKIKEYSNKYSNKNLIVLGVNSGDTSEKWQNAIKKNEFNWMQIRSTKDNNLLIPFNVTSFPTKILIDPDGKIIYSSKNTEVKEDVFQIIDRLFSKT